MHEPSNAAAARRALYVRGIIAIGRRMPETARPFYAAWLHSYVLSMGAGTLANVCEAIGVGGILPQPAARFAVWSYALAFGDKATGDAIEADLKAAGVWDDAMLGLDGIIEALRLHSALDGRIEAGTGGGHA